MNPAIILIVILAAVAAWFLAARYFRSTGEAVGDIIDEAIYEMTADEEETDDV